LTNNAGFFCCHSLYLRYFRKFINCRSSDLTLCLRATPPVATPAFSYCLTSRTTLCRQQFEKARKLDPTFDPEPGELGHPMWGKTWLKAKKAKV
jgi:hypothetical protein